MGLSGLPGSLPQSWESGNPRTSSQHPWFWGSLSMKNAPGWGLQGIQNPGLVEQGTYQWQEIQLQLQLGLWGLSGCLLGIRKPTYQQRPGSSWSTGGLAGSLSQRPGSSSSSFVGKYSRSSSKMKRRGEWSTIKGSASLNMARLALKSSQGNDP